MRILFISPKFFGYEILIKESFTKLGYKVDWYPHIHSSSKIIKILYRIFKSLMQYYYYIFLLDNVDSNQDYAKIVIIKGEGVGERALRFLKSSFPDATLIFYNWDSFRNNCLSDLQLKMYDRIKSFDSADCKLMKDVKHLPLFYCDEINKYSVTEHEFLFFFVGTLHSDRYQKIKEIIQNSDKLIANFIYIYYPSRLLFYINKFLARFPKELSISEVKFEGLSRENVIYYLSMSTCVIDFVHPSQSGLTIRSIEALGMRKKLITDNCAIVKYDFYNDSNIYVLGLSKGNIEEFLLKPYIDLHESIYAKYELRNWVMNLLN